MQREKVERLKKEKRKWGRTFSERNKQRERKKLQNERKKEKEIIEKRIVYIKGMQVKTKREVVLKESQSAQRQYLLKESKEKQGKLVRMKKKLKF